jgi:chaperonin GroES
MADMKLEPLGDRVVIEPIEEDEVTASGIVLPDTAKEKPQRGRIVAAGPGRLDDDGKRVPMSVAVDEVVLYAKYAGTEVKLGSTNLKKVLILSEKDILAKVIG